MQKKLVLLPEAGELESYVQSHRGRIVLSHPCPRRSRQTTEGEDSGEAPRTCTSLSWRHMGHSASSSALTAPVVNYDTRHHPSMTE